MLKNVGCNGSSIGIWNTRNSTDLCGTITLTYLWWKVLPRLMASKHLLAKKSGRKDWFSFLFLCIVTGLYILLWSTNIQYNSSQFVQSSKMISSWIFRQVVYREFNFESGKEYSFVRMWCISSGFWTHGDGKRPFIDISCIWGDVYKRWPWLRLRLGVLSKMCITHCCILD